MVWKLVEGNKVNSKNLRPAVGTIVRWAEFSVATQYHLSHKINDFNLNGF